eukprot:GHUV01045026.1.p2 GENE.GHUV01045026.1~~GHUV01045026.1.p2  ORF type:complete len:100 (-),score=17.76 GHUV01045026.1:51-350(-)
MVKVHVTLWIQHSHMLREVCGTWSPWVLTRPTITLFVTVAAPAGSVTDAHSRDLRLPQLHSQLTYSHQIVQYGITSLNPPVVTAFSIEAPDPPASLQHW